MKKLVLLLGLLAFIVQHQLFAQSGSAELYQRKVETFRKMKNAGLGLGIAGGVLTVTGIVLASSANWQQQSYVGSNSNYTPVDSKGVVGVLSIVAGIPMAVGGIVLGSIGSRKMKNYQQKLDGIRFNLLYTPHQRGITLAYRF